MALDLTTELCRLLGDPTRLRLLALLAREELTVAELTAVTQLAQSRVSTHLGRLRDAGMVRDRRAGSSSYYTLNEGGMSDIAGHLWTLLSEHTKDPLLERDRKRVDEILAARSRGRWADTVAGNMARHYSPGRTWEATARSLVGLVRLGSVIDVASGDGAVAELLAPRSASITCVDRSVKVVRAGARHMQSVSNVRFVQGDMHALPFADASFDQALLLNALTLTRTPERVLQEAARLLRPGARMVGVTLNKHRNRDAVAPYDHVLLGFEPQRLQEMVERSGFCVETCAVTSSETRPPYFEVITVHAHRCTA